MARLPFVKKITPPSYGTPRAGSVTTEGDGILYAEGLRTLGFDGGGVKIGIISDGITSLGASQATGDSPNVTTVTFPGSGDEGTAMIEIVHDLAPGSDLGFCGPNTSVEFAQCVTDLRTIFGADVIVDDLGYLSEPYFEDGPVAKAVSDVVTNGVLYVSAAGNDAQNHYAGTFTGTSAFGGNVHDFGTVSGGASDPTLNVLMAPNATIMVVLQWSNPFGAASDDYDLLLLNSAESQLLAGSQNSQNGVGDPFEALQFANPLNQVIEVKAVVPKFSGSDQDLKMFLLGGIQLEEYAVAAGSIFGHAAVNGMLSVGAIDANNPGNVDIEPFSSRGPVQIFFPTPETRQKPDIVGIDGVSVTGAGGFPTPFFGTSAAAPHLAGLAALLMEVSPTATPEEIRNALKNSAIDLGDPGFDNVFGAGRADVRAAAGLLNVAPESTIDEPASNTTIEVDESVTFSGTCTDASNTQGMSFSWNFGGGAGIAASSEEEPRAVVFGSTGTFTVTFTCTDGFEIPDASPATRTITVVEPAESPTGPSPATPSESPSDEPEEPASSSPASGGCSLIL